MRIKGFTTELKKGARNLGSGSFGSDRLTRALVWMAFLLLAGVAALSADLWFSPASGGQVAQAAGHGPSPTVHASPLPATVPPATASPMAIIASEGSPTPPPCIPPDGWSIYVVQEENTLDSIAQRYGTDVKTLMLVNCLNTATIFVDQRLHVPGSPAALTSTTPFPTSLPLPTNELLSGGPATAEAGGTAGMVTPMPVPTVKGAFRVDIPERYLNIVLLGSDLRLHSGAWRTDSMIIVSVDMQDNVVRLLSLPRDLWVYIPGYGYNRINTADLWGELSKKGGGPERVKETVYYNLGIPIHYYVRVDLRGFVKIIDTVGGVTIDVDCPLPDIQLSAGIHHMSGEYALRYARSRHSTNDFDRGRRQRKVLMALWEQALTLDLVPKLPSLWRTMADSYQTDLPLSKVIDLAYVGTRLKPQRILSRAIGASETQAWTTPEGAMVLLPRPDRIRALLQSYYAPVATSNLDATDRIRVQVLKGTQRKDADQLAAAALRWGGYQVTGSAPADRLYARSQIRVHNGTQADGEDAARLLNLPMTAVQVLTDAMQTPRPQDSADIEVILGQDYDPCQR